jgi:hypothetical protein
MQVLELVSLNSPREEELHLRGLKPFAYAIVDGTTEIAPFPVVLFLVMALQVVSLQPCISKTHLSRQSFTVDGSRPIDLQQSERYLNTRNSQRHSLRARGKKRFAQPDTRCRCTRMSPPKAE